MEAVEPGACDTRFVEWTPGQVRLTLLWWVLGRITSPVLYSTSDFHLSRVPLRVVLHWNLTQ